jgi:hypothetical protein
MAKQTPQNRLDVLAAAGLKPKEDVPDPKTLVQRIRGQNVVSEPTITSVSPEDRAPGGRPLKADEDKATEKVTAYFTPEQYDHIEELQRAYRKRTKKRISVNELLRRLASNATIEDILQ